MAFSTSISSENMGNRLGIISCKIIDHNLVTFVPFQLATSEDIDIGSFIRVETIKLRKTDFELRTFLFSLFA